MPTALGEFIRYCPGDTRATDRPGPWRSGVIEVSDDRLMQILQTLAVLLFLSVGALSLGRARYVWMKWARWGAIVIFSAAVVYALILTLRWALNQAAD